MGSANFWIGIVIGAGGAFATGFLAKAGGDLYLWFSKRYIANTQEFVEVDGRYNPVGQGGESLAWIPEHKLYDYQSKGYKYHWIDEKKNGCYRKTSNGSRVYKEFLMVKLD